MIRKWMTLLLSLLLAMMLPVAALADTQHSLRVIPGKAMSGDAAWTDLLNVLEIKLTTGESSGAFTVALADADIVTVALSADSTGLYAHSKELSDDVFYLTWDDGFALLANAMEQAMVVSGASASDLEAMTAAMEQAKGELVQGFSGSFAPAAATAATPEDVQALYAEMFPDDPEMVAYAMSVFEDTVHEDGQFTDPARDPATQKTSLTVTAEDFIGVYETKYMRDLLTQTLSAESPTATADEIAKRVDEAIAEAVELVENGTVEMTATTYTADDGETLVGMNMSMLMDLAETNAAEAERVKMNMDFSYDKLTSTSGVEHTASMRMMVNDEALAELRFELGRENSGVSQGMAALLVDGTQLTVTYRAENTGDNTRERLLSAYMRENAAAIIEPAAYESAIISFEIVSTMADPAVLAPVENATAQNSVNVLKLSDEEMASLSTALQSRGLQVLYNALPKLPTSIISLLMGSM